MADDDSRVQQRANAVVSLMTFTVVPDITASNINIGSGTNQSSALNMTQIGGGAAAGERPDLSGRNPGVQPLRSPVRGQQRQREPHRSPPSGTA